MIFNIEPVANVLAVAVDRADIAGDRAEMRRQPADQQALSALIEFAIDTAFETDAKTRTLGA